MPRLGAWMRLLLKACGALLLVVTASVPLDFASAQAIPGPVVVYLANPGPALVQFRATSQVQLEVPYDPAYSPQGFLVVQGVDETSKLDTNIYDFPATTGGSITSLGVADVAVLSGTVVGFPTSTATLFIGQYGVYGFVAINDAATRTEYWFDSNSADETLGMAFMQIVSMEKSPTSVAPPPVLPGPLYLFRDDPNPSPPSPSSPTPPLWTCNNPPAQAPILLIATQGFVEANPNSYWDRMVSAWSTSRPAFAQACIDLTAVGAIKTHDIASGSPTHTSDDCPTVRGQFRTWLDTHKNTIWSKVSSQVTYQLWTAADLKKDGNTYKCFGTSAGDVTPQTMTGGQARKDRALLAVSIVEGRDVNAQDLYDPSELKQRTVVSAHEHGHVFGEENHPEGTCYSSVNSYGWGYNIMQDNGHWRKNNSPCFLQSSVNEINYMFYRGAEY